MSVRVLAFFDTRYQTTPALAAFVGAADPWRFFRESRPTSRAHGVPNWPSALGPYDLARPDQAAAVVGMAAAIGIDGFVVPCLAQGDRYGTGAEAIAPLTGPSFGLAFHWDVAADPPWQAPLASGGAWPARAARLVAALRVGSHVLADGRTVLLVDHPDMLALPQKALATLRDAAKAAALPGLYLVAVRADVGDARATGFDAVVDPGPADWAAGCAQKNKPTGFNHLEVMAGWRDLSELTDRYFDYSAFVISRMKNRDHRGPVLPRVFPGYQDWPLHPDGAATLLLPRGSEVGGSEVGGGLQRHYYGAFLENAMLYAYDRFPSGEALVFLQSWNGWTENSQIEPSMLDGDIPYEATREAIAKGRFAISAKAHRVVP